MEVHLKYLLHIGETLKNFILKKFLPLKKKYIKEKKFTYFKYKISPDKILPKNWFKKFEKYWHPSEENALKELKIFIKNKIESYADARNFPYIIGTSKLSPFIKHGQFM